MQEGHLTFEENQRGVSFDALFGPYLAEAERIEITDPYIRAFRHARNLMELLETIARSKPDDEEVTVHLITTKDQYDADQQADFLTRIQTSAMPVGIHFDWEFKASESMHARHIVTDHGWKISLGRGLDIFQHYEGRDAFTFENRLQQFRQVRPFEVTYIKP